MKKISVMVACIGMILLFSANSFSEMVIKTTDGNTYNLPIDRQNIQSIEFTGEGAAGGEVSNLAQGKTAQQSSVGYGGNPMRAVDGNTNGNYYGHSVTHTASQNQAWWQVDLGKKSQIKSIRVWNRTDCCPERLSKFYVLVSDSPMTSNNLQAVLSQPGVWNKYFEGAAATPSEISVNRSGQYIRIQLSGTNYLSLAEVEVLGF